MTLTTLQLIPYITYHAAFASIGVWWHNFLLFPLGHTSPKWRPNMLWLIKYSNITFRHFTETWPELDLSQCRFHYNCSALHHLLTETKYSTHIYSIIKHIKDALNIFFRGWSDQHSDAWESLDRACDVWLIDGWLEAACCSRQGQMSHSFNSGTWCFHPINHFTFIFYYLKLHFHLSF